jgi:epsilon-lactone hydrolase
MAERLRAAGRDVDLELWPRMFHVWPMFARILPEAHTAIARIGAFLRPRL